MPDKVRLLGDKFAEAGSVAWANWQRTALQNQMKNTKWDAKHLAHQVRVMCDPPAWHQMDTKHGRGFRTFEEFVTADYPWGLGYKDYREFQAIILSEIKDEREYELLTNRPGMSRREAGKEKGRALSARPFGDFKLKQLRAINRADPFIQNLYKAELIEARLAALFGPVDEERKRKASVALKAVKAVSRNGDNAAYRAAINKAVREAMARPQPSKLDRAKKLCAGLSAAERRQLARWLSEQM
jgi:hypothetical protein